MESENSLAFWTLFSTWLWTLPFHYFTLLPWVLTPKHGSSLHFHRAVGAKSPSQHCWFLTCLERGMKHRSPCCPQQQPENRASGGQVQGERGSVEGASDPPSLFRPSTCRVPSSRVYFQGYSSRRKACSWALNSGSVTARPPGACNYGWHLHFSDEEESSSADLALLRDLDLFIRTCKSFV